MSDVPANGYLRFPTKLFEIRDRATFIPVIATRLLVRTRAHWHGVDPQRDSQFNVDDESEQYLLRRAGYGEQITDRSELPYIFVARLAGGAPATYDPYDWANRTMTTAHQHMIDHWDDLVSGQVIDVEHILGETEQPKVSERLTSPY